VCELEKALPETFTGIANAVTLSPKDWHRWYLSVKPAPPESAQLPGEWETKCEDRLKKMIVLRCFRTDRVNFAIRNYVEHFMKKEFTENRPTILKDVLDESQPGEPLVFVLSPGVDPADGLRRQADERHVTFEAISMGRGQSERAKRILTEGAEQGSWIFLANCHLSVSLLPELESIIDQLFKHEVNPEFRLILSARSHPQFSISLLQRSAKIAQEPPRGIKANLLRLYGQKSEFTVVDQDRNFRKAVFGLCWFHTVLIERKKFKSLGWNVSYAFNDSDYSVCEDLLAIYMGWQVDGKAVDAAYEKRAPLPWQAIQYLVAAANYGGRVTDDRDRRLIQVYAKEIFNEALIAPERWRPYGTDDLTYVYPADEQNVKHPDPSQLFTPEFFYDEILNKMDEADPPAAYGQHINAEITSQILDSTELLDSVLSLTPQKSGGGDAAAGGGELRLIADLLARLPELVDVRALKHKLKGDENPLNVVLVQEIQRYHVLLRRLRTGLDQLESGLKGLVVISPELEGIQVALRENKVPAAWAFAYFSLKPLANWFEDLRARYDFLAVWSQKGIPFHFWIGAFTYPTGFTTSLLQRFSRKASGAPIDKLEFDFVPVPKEPREIAEHPKDGAFISGLFLEGAKWNPEKLCLCEPEVMELACPMPVLHFKPIQKRAKPPQNVYECPCYYFPKRDGTVDRDSWMLRVDLKSGDYPAEFWVKRGAALLMSLAF
jgi:dynein heavy chain